MKIGIITDSTCDLPQTKIFSPNLHILPIKIFNDKTYILNKHTIDNNKEIYPLIKNNANLYCKPISPKEIKDFFLNIISQHDYTHLICIFPMQSRSDTYHNVLNVIPQIITEARKIKKNENQKSSLKIDVIDSTQISAGLGLIVADAIYRNSKQYSSEKIIEKIHYIAKNTQTYVIPNNLSAIYYGKIKQDNKLGFATYLLGSTLDLKPIILTRLGQIKTIDTIQGFDNAFNKLISTIILYVCNQKFKTNHMVITYSGSLTALSQKEKFKELTTICKENQVLLNTSKMSASMSVELGLGAFAISLVSRHIIDTLD